MFTCGPLEISRLLPLPGIWPHVVSHISADQFHLLMQILHKWHLYRVIVQLFNCIISRYYQLTDITKVGRAVNVETTRAWTFPLWRLDWNWFLVRSQPIPSGCLPWRHTHAGRGKPSDWLRHHLPASNSNRAGWGRHFGRPLKCSYMVTCPIKG